MFAAAGAAPGAVDPDAEAGAGGFLDSFSSSSLKFNQDCSTIAATLFSYSRRFS